MQMQTLLRNGISWQIVRARAFQPRPAASSLNDDTVIVMRYG